MWEPWVGSGYGERCLLLLGESCYNWTSNGSEVLNYPQDDHPSIIVRDSQIAPLEGSSTMIKLTQAICKVANPSIQQATDEWNKVAFTNYVPTTVGDGAKMRPRTSAWKQAEEEWPILLA